MAIITIKRSQSNDVPESLANGEIAYSYSSNKLFIGQTESANSAVSVEYIGGKLIVDKVANLESIVLEGGDVSLGNVDVNGTLTISEAYKNSILFSKNDNNEIGYLLGDSGQFLQVAANGSPVFDDINGGEF